ncbi:PmbA protein [Pseudobutyrivibrio sp. 49]|uniref:metallopeptidase TldD-related protein n=1 Tax=Pseudobutyrivibrio sp. 49 TaxID=1855344 RepID=UPI0008845CE4|nr:metallopeptidase TldD-related protein [Pseudobutyrivibrio sp. 49]SDH87064.1 PmbA protein [Pseudobutyrivibrio sp. 49]
MSDMTKIQQAADYLTGLLEEKKDIKAQFEVSEIVTTEVTSENGDFTLLRTLFDKEVGIHVIADHKPGLTKINSFEEPVLKETLEGVIASTASAGADECFDIAPKIEGKEFTRGPLEPDVDKLMTRAVELQETIAKEYPNVLVSMIIIEHVRKDSLYRNTNGTEDIVHEGHYSMFLEFAGNDGTNTSGISFSAMTIENLDTPFIELGRIRKDLAEAEQSVNPVPIEGKFEGQLIFTPECFRALMYTYMEIALSDDVIIDNSSLWRNKIGQKVAVDSFTASIKPWDERIINHEYHTNDGFRSEDYTIIENGILNSFATTLFGANKAKVDRAGNTDLCYVVEPGDTSLDDMIKNVTKGLIVGSISCGEPRTNGELAGVAKNAFYVENGEIKNAVSETMVSFNAIKILENIVSISKEVLANGDWVLPYICVDGVTISGK